MHETAATTLSSTWVQALRRADVWPWDAERTDRSAAIIVAGIVEALRCLVPAEIEAAAVLEWTDTVPGIYVIAGDGLFVVNCAEADPRLRVHSSVRRVQLDPGKAIVGVRALLQRDAIGIVRGDLHWRFELGTDFALTFTTHPGPDEPAHAFALALAATLDWQLDDFGPIIDDS